MTVRHPASPLEATLNDTLDSGDNSDDPLLRVPVIVLLWSRDEPERCGEAAHLYANAGATYTLGRAVDVGDHGEVPLTFGQMRPRGRIDTGALRSAHISRRHLALQLEDELLRVELLGRGVLRLDGHPMTAGVLAPGGLIEVQNRCVLLYTHRPAGWTRPRVAGLPDTFAFASADPFGLVGETPTTWELREQVEFLASRDEHVLVHGPSGSGKELLVSAIHGLSSRAGGPLVARNAATIPETLIDAELFGNPRNYPNPGMPERPGLLGEADRGTLFLDEIGELPLAMQAHLLRVMDAGEYQRLGEAKVRRTDMRLVAATNRDPKTLKHDLLARFPHRLSVPGLAARAEDVILIARHLVHKPTTPPEPAPALGSELTCALLGYPFATHVRELLELLWRARKFRPGPVLVPPAELVHVARPRPTDAAEPATTPSTLSREAVLEVLERCGGIKETAWRELGLRNRFQLHRVLKKLGID